MISHRDNLLSTLRREGFERVPIDMNLSPSQIRRFEKETGLKDIGTFFNISHRYAFIKLTPEFSNGQELFSREELPESTEFSPWGTGRSKGSKEAAHMKRYHHPLKGNISLSEIEAYPFPTIEESEFGRFAERVSEIHKQEYVASGALTQTIWERAWDIRSMEDLMMDMIIEDDKAVILLDKVKSLSIEQAKIHAKAGCDILQLGDDIGMQNSIMMSLEMWRQWIKPRMAEVIAAAKLIKPNILIFYHSCGYIEPFIGDLIDIGIDILNPIQPECMDFAKIHRMYGDQLSFWGTIGTQSTLPFGSVEDVKKVVRKNISICGEKGGIVIAPTHLVEPEVPWENIIALKEAVESYIQD